MTQVSEVMTRGVRSMSPRDPIVRAAQAMEELDVGVVPVCENDRLVGMVTDRDIVVRGIAKGRPVENTPLTEVMSRDPRACFEDQSIDEVLEQMRDAQIRRVPVLDHERHLVGMLSLGDVAVKADIEGAGVVLEQVSEPAQPSGQPAAGGAGAAASGAGPTSGARDTSPAGGAAQPAGGGASAPEDAAPGRQYQGTGVMNEYGRFGSSKSPEELGDAQPPEGSGGGRQGG